MVGKKGIPTKEEIKKLPRRAQVAFAARCARRVQPVFKAAWPEATEEHVEAIERAIRCAETAAAGADVAAYAAAYAACATWISGERYIRRDFGRLAAAARKEGWTDETAVPPEFFGPLWAEGEEPDWGKIAKIERGADVTEMGRSPQFAVMGRVGEGGEKAEHGGEERLLLRVDVAEGADDDEVVDGIVELYRALNKYHIACGGRGLTIEDWRMFVREGAGKGVLV